MSDIPMRNCADCGPQPVWEFYATGVYCKACTKRRATENQKARRAANAAVGLPVITPRKPIIERKPEPDYLGRHIARRAEEAAMLSGTQRTGPVELSGVCSIETEHSYSSLVGLINDLLRKPTKVSSWRVA